MSTLSHDNSRLAPLGILMLETTFPRIKGDIGNPDTFSFPVLYETVPGATPQKVVIDADERLLDTFIAAGYALIAKGVQAIITSCGFLALFHKQMVAALPVPVFTSSLLQVHLAHAVIRSNQKIGIITASRLSLTKAHLAGVGIQDHPLVIVGMEDQTEFSSVFLGGKPILNEHLCRQEIRSVAGQLIHHHPDIGAIVLECTNLPPYSDIVRQTTGLPVFDAVTMVNYVHGVLGAGRCRGDYRQ